MTEHTGQHATAAATPLLGAAAQVLRPARTDGDPTNGGISSHADTLTITHTAAEDGHLTPLMRRVLTGRVRPGAPEAWLYLRSITGRPVWAVVPAMPAGHRRDPHSVRRYLSGWMAGGAYAALQDPAAVVGWYGAVAIHDRREWPPYLPSGAG